MVSLINLFLNIWRKNKIIRIHRLPPTKIFRANQLGLTFALIFSILAIALNFNSLFNHLPWYTSPLLALIMALCTYWGGPFVIIIGLYALITFLAQKFGGYNPTGTWAALYLMAKWYLGGYAFGAIFAILYNDMVFLFINIFDQKRVKIVFAYDPKEKINIIKSPISKEEVALNKLFKDDPKLKERRLYQYTIKKPVGKNPYTIAFVANPKVLKKRNPADDYEAHRLNPKNYYVDPIIYNRDLFLKNVERALSSFEHNEVIGRPEIWSRVRILTIFDPTLATKPGPDCACLEEYQDDFIIAARVIDNLIDPMEQVENVVINMLNNYNQSHIPDPITIKDIDVIYALSAAPNHDRSTAHYSAYRETIDINNPDTNLTGEPFKFDPDPNTEHPKLSEICVHKCTSCIPVGDKPCGNIPANTRFICQHEHYAEHPGRVALNVIGARNKTFVHEFAHAMSSAFRGAITEEYADQAIIRKLGKPGVAPKQFECKKDTKAPFYVNRIEKNQEVNKLIGVHEVFAKYNGVIYLSDLAHPSSEEEWVGYFPERYNRAFGCIMDRTIGHYEFDRLISTFMYDRLMVKINRPDRT